ncbi:Transposon TX1 uncharacterized protein [Chionoecetes opilio]|uniref:Transposon TX1 uncharacterized protein n=1 Tax=Chionoecetes opilio TaxID=41210 RepID=A0A8J4YBE2_CHIOP|nr:Transposon TX1 uncharacterized protein [Chionoecetes opilio]
MDCATKVRGVRCWEGVPGAPSLCCVSWVVAEINFLDLTCNIPPVLRPRGTAPVLRPAAEVSCKVASGATPKQVVFRAPCGEEFIARALPSDASVALEAGDGAELRQGEGDADSAVDAPQDQGGNWSTVDRQGKRRQPAHDTGSKRPRFKLGCTTGYANHYLAVIALQRDLPGLQMDVRSNLKGEYVLTPKGEAATDRMCDLAQERDAPARLVLLDHAERHTKAVLQRYPLDMPLEAVRDHPSVISAGRLHAVRDRAPTRQRYNHLQGYVRSLAEDVEGHLNANDLRPAYRALKKLRSKSPSRASAIRTADGRLVSDMDGQMARWAEYFGQLFTVDPPSEQLHTTGLQTVDADPPIDETAPSLDEVREAVAKLKGGKAAAVCNISAELLKAGGEAMIRGLHAVLIAVWQSGTIPPDWKRGLVVPIWKWKGDRQDCNNYRGITLLSVPGKVLAHLLLTRIRSHLVKHQRPQQSGFTPGKSTTDRILALRVLVDADVSFDMGCLQSMLISRRRLTQCIVSHSGIFCDFEGFLQGLLV